MREVHRGRLVRGLGTLLGVTKVPIRRRLLSQPGMWALSSRDLLPRSVRRRGPSHPFTLLIHADLGMALTFLGEYAAAEPELRAVAEQWEASFGPQQPAVLRAQAWHAHVLGKLGRTDEAETELRAVAEAREELPGTDPADALHAFECLAVALHDARRDTEAEAVLAEALTGQESWSGTDDAATMRMRARHAVLLSTRRRWAEAGRQWLSLRDARCRVFGSDHPDTLRASEHLGIALARAGRYGDADRELADLTGRRVAVSGRDHLGTLRARAWHAYVLAELGRDDEAEAAWRGVCQAGDRLIGPDDPQAQALRNRDGQLLYLMARFDQAEREDTEAAVAACTTARIVKEHAYLLRAQDWGMAALECLDYLDEARAELAYGAAGWTAHFGGVDAVGTAIGALHARVQDRIGAGGG
jgi:hypothetical protein